MKSISKSISMMIFGVVVLKNFATMLFEMLLGIG
jgi:hypothetical protein